MSQLVIKSKMQLFFKKYKTNFSVFIYYLILGNYYTRLGYTTVVTRKEIGEKYNVVTKDEYFKIKLYTQK